MLLFIVPACGRGGFGVFGARDAEAVPPGGDDDLNQDPAVNDNLDLGPIALQDLVPGRSSTWNAYVHTEGGSPLTFGDTPCTDTDDYRTCVHVGERIRVDVAQATACAGLAMTDSLDAFDWECVAHDATVTFVSAGLKQGRGLRDLVDFGTTAFKPMSVLLTSRTGRWTSPARVYWTNPVVVDVSGLFVSGPATVALGGPSSIYLFSGTMAQSYALTDDGVAIVGAPGVVLTANPGNNNTTNACEAWDPPSAVFYHGPCAIAARGVKRVWIEIDLGRSANQTSDGIGIELTGVAQGHVHNVSIAQDYRTPLQLTAVRGARIIGLTASRADYLPLVDSNGNFFRDIRLAGLGGYLKRSSRNRFERVTSFGTETGWTLTQDCVADTFTQVLSFGHNEMAFHTADPGNDALTVVGFTLASTAYQGLGAWAYTNATFHLGLTLNAGDFGFVIIGDRATVSDLTTSEHTKGGIDVDGGGGPQRFTGQIRSANNVGVCYADASVADPGFSRATCEHEGLSDPYALDDAFPKTAGSFVGNLTTEPANTSGVDGRAQNPAQFAPFDFAGASNPFRGWVRAGEFLTAAQRDCAWLYAKNNYDPAGFVQLVDFSLKASDDIVRNRTLSAGAPNAAFLDGAACPAGLDGNNVTSDIMHGEVQNDGRGNEDSVCDIGEACAGNVYLHGAIELLDDGYGDDDGLCESNERCLYAPNFGAYQGHGDGFLAHRCAFTDGVVQGVRMYAYPTNGY